MTTETQLAQQLIEAYRAARHDVDPAPYAALDRAAAYRIQKLVIDGLGETTGMLKVGVAPDGAGIVAPIYQSGVGESGKLRLPSAKVAGLEVEVAVVLGRDLDMATARDDAAIIEAIDHYIVGVEVCGSRFSDRRAVGAHGGLADSVSALGYAIDPTPRESGADIDNFDVIIEFGGQQIWAAPAKHSFGTVLKSFLAYAKGQHPDYPLRAGMIVTTGSLCGLVPTSGAGHVVARLGSHVVELDLV
jgi:2-keto-4-pentenoate hydratase